MLFKCRFCGSFSDDGDLINYVCLHCIDELSQHCTHEINKNSDFKKAAEKLKKSMYERGKIK